MRVPQNTGTDGSLKWLQRLVECHPTVLNDTLRRAEALPANHALHWKSPLREDQYAEYRDNCFLRKLDLESLAPHLAAFWPKTGPQWDALATDRVNRVFLFEAKAHGSEMHSNCKARGHSRDMILASCHQAKAFLGASPNADWLTGYYHYANRLAHLALLRTCSVYAWLVFLYFTGDAKLKGPASEEEWKPFIGSVHENLGLPKHLPHVISVFQHVDAL